MNLYRLSVAATLGLLTAIAAADSYIVVELNSSTTPTAVATQYGVVLTDATSDGAFAMYQTPTTTQADTVAAQMTTNPSIVSVDVQVTTSPNPRLPEDPGKGSTIPAVGDRAELQFQNQALLGLINWKPGLANSTGREVRVAILDTGLSDENPALWAKVVASRNFVEPNRLAIDRPTGVDSNEDGKADGLVGHGTMVAGIVDFVAPQTKLVVARVADGDGSATPWSIVKGIRFAVEQGAEVINLSFATTKRNKTIARAVEYAERKGILVVAGIGNSAVSDAFYPAKFPTVVGVSALDADGVKAPFSNWSSKTEVAAPGYSIVSQYWDGELVQWSGTSFASAFVTATVADCLRRRSPMEPKKIRRALERAGVNINRTNPQYKNKLGLLIDHAELDREIR
jgi:hypothetical protein